MSGSLGWRTGLLSTSVLLGGALAIGRLTWDYTAFTARSPPPRTRSRIMKRSGAAHRSPVLSTTLVGGLLLAFWMTPVALDWAAASPWCDAGKSFCLLAAGAAAWVSWRAAGLIVQTFFVGTAAWMATVIGMLLQELPQRLCNAYLQDDQVFTGFALVMLSITLSLCWLAWRMTRLHRNSTPLESGDIAHDL